MLTNEHTQQGLHGADGYVRRTWITDELIFFVMVVFFSSLSPQCEQSPFENFHSRCTAAHSLSTVVTHPTTVTSFADTRPPTTVTSARPLSPHHRRAALDFPDDARTGRLHQRHQRPSATVAPSLLATPATQRLAPSDPTGRPPLKNLIEKEDSRKKGNFQIYF
jgi:hypothetical protein